MFVPTHKCLAFLFFGDGLVFRRQWLTRFRTIGQRLDRISVTRSFCLLKNTDSVPQTFALGGTTEVQTFQQNTAVFRLQKQFTLQRQRLHYRCLIHSVHSSLTRGKFCSHAVFLRSLVLPERSSSTWPPICTYAKLTWITMQMKLRLVQLTFVSWQPPPSLSLLSITFVHFLCGILV